MKRITSLDKVELVSYMSGLLAIMESKEDAAISRGNTLGREYDRCYQRLKELIKEDE